MAERIKIESEENSLRVTMPSRKIWREYSKGNLIGSAIIFTVLVAGSIYVTFYFLPMFLGQRLTDLSWLSFMCLLWSLFFPLWLLYAFYFLLRMATAREIVQVNSELLTINRRELGIERSRTYLAIEIQRLQVFPVYGTWHERNFVVFGRTRGTLGFEYRLKRIRFGTSLDEYEATQILKTIATRFPNYFQVSM